MNRISGFGVVSQEFRSPYLSGDYAFFFFLDMNRMITSGFTMIQVARPIWHTIAIVCAQFSG